jgi:hypothetical protein
MPRKRKRSQSIGGQFAPRLIEMLESPAYRALSLSARRVLDRIEIELAHHGGRDNGGLPVTYHDFEAYDPNGNYEPSNCRWGDAKQQAPSSA